MISVIEELEKIIDERYIYLNDKGKIITLQENSPKAICKNVTLKKTDKIKTLTLQLDLQGEDIHPLFKAIKDVKKSIDYLIFCETEEDLYVLVAEMKSENDDHWHRQAKAGLAIAEYILGLIEGYQKVNLRKNLGNQLKFRCILFSSKSQVPKALKRKLRTKEIQKVEYLKHPIFEYLHCRRKCDFVYWIDEFLI